MEMPELVFVSGVVLLAISVILPCYAKNGLNLRLVRATMEHELHRAEIRVLKREHKQDEDQVECDAPLEIPLKSMHAQIRKDARIAELDCLRSQLDVLGILEWIGIIAGFCLAVAGFGLWFLGFR